MNSPFSSSAAGAIVIIIYGIKEQLNAIKFNLSNTLQQCMEEVLGMPEDKRAHRFIPMEKEDFYYPGGRSDAYTVIEINMMQGRTEETKKALIKAIFSKIETDLGIKPVDIEITIQEQPPHCWGFRGITGDEAKLNYSINR
jgi:phenylpyruvate tautomerase PptA (4-oxalocrotonate tautomerase family)